MRMIAGPNGHSQRLSNDQIPGGAETGEARVRVAFTIPGVVPSLKNQKRLGRGRMFDDPQVKAYKRDFPLHVPSKYRNLRLGGLRQLLALRVTLYHDSWRRDAEMAIIADCLQVAGVVSNDRWIRVIEIDARAIDRDNPRAEITLSEL